MTQPTPAQRRYLDLRLGMMLHFGINTYYDKEWSDGTLDASRFDPGQLDTDSWCESAAAAGMKLVVLTTKHHDGFCLWPTKHSSYGVMSSPCRRDVVGELAESCRKFGLRLSVYYSLWDRRHDTGDDAAYADFMFRQLEELFTSYGDIAMLWLDGVWFKLTERTPALHEMENIHLLFPGAKPEAFVEAWNSIGRRRWHFDQLYAQVKSWQPDCLVMNNTTTEFPGLPLFPVDARCGEKATALGGDKKVWSFAKDNQFVIVSKDADFYELSLIHGAPPKIIWIRLGNCRTEKILQAVRQHTDALQNFNKDPRADAFFIS